MKFSYRAWALECAAELLRSDVDCGLEVADGTPNGDRARNEIMSIAKELADRGRKIRDRESVKRTGGARG